MMPSRTHNPSDVDSPPFDCLPEDYIAKIISLTSPRDACVVATVSKNFESAAKSDVVWEKFLPPQYSSLIPRSRVFSSKKELYLALCDDPVLFDDGKKSLWLEKASGKKCTMLSAMDLTIVWGENPEYWRWITLPDSRFESVAELLQVCWFEITGWTNTHDLSPQTRYSAYIVFKTNDKCSGFDEVAIEAEVGPVGHKAPRRFICFDASADEFLKRGRQRRNLVKPEDREDGWMEIELGDFFTDINSEEIKMRTLNYKQLNWKCGLIIQGIEIRPASFE